MTSPKGRTVSGTPTGERARSGGSARADLSVARSRARWHGNMKHCVCRRSASFDFLSSVLSLSSLLFTVVIAGLDPAIHTAAKLDQTFRSSFASRTSAWTTGSSPVVTGRIRRCLTL
jgi:hypothetical protein